MDGKGAANLKRGGIDEKTKIGKKKGTASVNKTYNKKMNNMERFIHRKEEKLRKQLDLKVVDATNPSSGLKQNKTNDVFEVYDKVSYPKIFRGGKAYISVTNAFPKILQLNQQTEANAMVMSALRNTTQFTSMEL